MKKQIRRLSPHQNAKVFSILMALSSLVFILPMFAIMSLAAPNLDPNGNPVNSPPTFFFLIMPVIYLVFTYVSVAIGCVIYNFMVKYVGGIEFELEDENA